MYNIPEQYYVRPLQKLEIKQLAGTYIKRADRNRLYAAVQEICLSWQIAGEAIPSIINDTYNCQVIMGLDIVLKKLSDAAFVASIAQARIKAPCVIHFQDDLNECYSYAHKRLSLIDSTEVTVLDRIETLPIPLELADSTKDMLRKYLDYERLLCRSDKLSLYLEAMTKAFLISHMNLYSGLQHLLDDKLWYDRNATLAVLEHVKTLQSLTRQAQREAVSARRAMLLGQIRTTQTDIENICSH